MRSTSALTAVVVSVVFTVLSILAVLLRQYAQSLKRNTWTIEAGFLIAAVTFACGHCGLIIFGAVDGGLGWSTQDLMTTNRFPTFLNVIEASQVLSATAISLVRISLLLFYRRVFPTPKFRIADTVMLVLTICWWLQNVIGTTTATKPDLAQIKINYPAWLLTQAILNLLLDIATLCLPLFVIRTLHVSRRKKIMIAGIFGLGFFCIIASIVRVVYFVQLNRLTFLDTPFSSTTVYCTIWAVIEPCTSTIACCLPACTPLLRHENGLTTIVQKMVSFLSLGSSRGSGSSKSNLAFPNAKTSGSQKYRSRKVPEPVIGETRPDEYEMMPDDEQALRSQSEMYDGRSVQTVEDVSAYPKPTV